MKILIAAIGRAKINSPEGRLIAEYSKRLTWKYVVRELDIKSFQSPEERKTKEAGQLLAACKGYARIIALDERGKDLKSRELADTFSGWQQQGASSVAIIIGGADGLADEVRHKADLVLSFGKLTWPHMLVRTMLFEQLYRVQSIIDGHPYHRE